MLSLNNHLYYNLLSTIMNARKFLRRYNRIFIPVGGILFSVLVFYLSLINPALLLLIFLIPVVIFLLMHYLNMYRFKPRFFGGIAILLVTLIIVSGIYSNALYTSNGIDKENIDNTLIETVITPYSGIHNNYNITVITNYTGILNQSYLRITSSTYNKTIEYNDLHPERKNNETYMFYNAKNLPSGLYILNYTVNKNITMEVEGPIKVSEFTLFEYYVYAVALKYMLSIAILYLAGISIAYFFNKNKSIKK